MPGATSYGGRAEPKPGIAALADGRRIGLVESLLDAALVALRNGTLDELVRQRPRAARYLMRPFAGLVRGAAGDLLDGESAEPRIARVLLRWLVLQLRPDGEASFERISSEAWLNLTSWRSLLAVACHAGVLPVPEFRERYRRRADEAILDNLCGLWNVGPSSFYRYQERGKRVMAQVWLESPLPVARRLSLRQFVVGELLDAGRRADEAARRSWHRAQMGRALARRDAASVLWHAWQGGDASAFAETLRTHATALAGEPETDALVARMAALALPPHEEFDLWLARAALARVRNAPERELAALEKALQMAHAAADTLRQGIAYAALGKFHEPRDADRAFACYQDSAEFLRDVDAGGDAAVVGHYLTTLVRLAWLYVLRNDTRAKAVLDRADQLRLSARVPDDVLGMLEQSWGEYWRRSGELARSLEHRLRALNIFERIGDERAVLTTSLNLIQVYAELKQFDRATAYADRVLSAAARAPVEPAIVISAHLNLGATQFLQQQLDAAIDNYQRALQHSLSAGLRLHAFRARYNLAEAHYRRFRDHGDPLDEQLGDRYVEQALEAPASDSSPAAIESIRALKGEVLGKRAETAPDRLQPAERSVHADETAEIQRQRGVLSVPGAPEAHVDAHLAIASAYLQMSVKEREAARQLIERHGLQQRFAGQLSRLRETFDRQLTREQRLAGDWLQLCGDLFDAPRAAAIVGRLLRDGSINKSAYAELCGVSPATASKHLATLTERGLVTQVGKGPSTRYTIAP